MSSSDDEWLKPPAFPLNKTPSGSRGGEDAMLAARRRAMQQQREAAATAVTVGAVTSRGALPQVVRGADASMAKQEPKEVGVTEEMLESLRRELAAKKKVLVRTSEKEAALREQWRTQKAQRLAEIAQLDAKIRHQRDAMEDVKAAAERELHEAEDVQQKRLAEERRMKEAEIRDQYEGEISARRAELGELREREKRLQAELNMGDTNKDLVNKCISSALATILQRVEGMFAANTGELKEWEDEVQRLVRHEVCSSFAVASDSETQQRLEDYQRLFQDTLEFWKKAEEEEREHVLKMDEQVLLDLQSMVHDDLDRLQREELSMEELYVQSRESWATEHQKILQRELDAAMTRRTAEFEEQRAMRHQLHLERMKAVEERQRDMLEKQRWFHEKQMALLREEHAKEERLSELRSRFSAAMQADISRAAEEFSRTMQHIESLLQRLKEYRIAVDEGRVVLQKERQRTLEDREATMSMLQDAVAKQTVSVQDEHNSLMGTLTKLEALHRAVETHLENERVWLSKQEAAFVQGKTEWEREYKQWKQMVEDEKCIVQERFSGALMELRNAAVELANEEREAEAEQSSTTLWFRTINKRTAEELNQIQRREQDLKERHDTVHRLIEKMEQKGVQVTQEWRKLQHDRQELQVEENALREDEIHLQQTSNYLQVLKAQLDTARTEDAAAQEHARALQHELRLSQNVVETRQMKFNKPQRHTTPTALMSRKAMPKVSQKANRLPLRVLHELRELLEGNKWKHPHRAPAPALHDNNFDLAYSTTHKEQKAIRRHTEHKQKLRREAHIDPIEDSLDGSENLYDSLNNNFTSLIPLSDNESLQQSPHTSA